MPQNNSDFVGSEQTLTISSEFKLVNTSMLVQIHQKLFLKCYLKLLCKVLVLVLNFLQIIKKLKTGKRKKEKNPMPQKILLLPIQKFRQSKSFQEIPRL